MVTIYNDNHELDIYVTGDSGIDVESSDITTTVTNEAEIPDKLTYISKAFLTLTVVKSWAGSGNPRNSIGIAAEYEFGSPFVVAETGDVGKLHSETHETQTEPEVYLETVENNYTLYTDINGSYNQNFNNEKVAELSVELVGRQP